MSGTNSLALTQIITGEEPYTLTFSIPLTMDVKTHESHYVSTNNCYLYLFDNDQIVSDYFYRLTNQTYRVEYGTPFSISGEKHILKVALATTFLKIYGPPLTVSYTNLFQFDGNVFGGTSLRIHCNLGVQRAGYKIDIFDTNKNLLKTITGQTDAGVIDKTWDLKTTNGQVRMDDELYAEYFIWHVHNGTNQDASNNIFIPTNPFRCNLLRDKLPQVLHR